MKGLKAEVARIALSSGRQPWHRCCPKLGCRVFGSPSGYCSQVLHKIRSAAMVVGIGRKVCLSVVSR